MVTPSSDYRHIHPTPDTPYLARPSIPRSGRKEGRDGGREGGRKSIRRSVRAGGGKDPADACFIAPDLSLVALHQDPNPGGDRDPSRLEGGRRFCSRQAGRKEGRREEVAAVR